MEKLLCPYCDHEIKKAGRCATCGSKVRKPVKVQTSAVYDTKPSAQPGECGCDVHSPKQGSGASRTNQENWKNQANQQNPENWKNQANQQSQANRPNQANLQNRANWQNQENRQNQTNRQSQQNQQKPIKNSYSPFLEHIKNLPTVTKIVLIYVIINLVIAFINVVLMTH